MLLLKAWWIRVGGCGMKVRPFGLSGVFRITDSDSQAWKKTIAATGKVLPTVVQTRLGRGFSGLGFDGFADNFTGSPGRSPASKTQSCKSASLKLLKARG